MTTREPFQIRVHLIEARGIKGQAQESDLVNPVIRVSLEAGAVKKSQRSAIYKDVRRHPHRVARCAAAPIAGPRATAAPAVSCARRRR